MIEIAINDRWPLLLPEHRAARPEWPWWERERLAAMYAEISLLRSQHDGLTIYDIGTEEGDLSALLSVWAGPAAHVHLFEPNARVWPNVRAIWEANELPPPAGCVVGFAASETRLHGASWCTDPWPQCAYGPLIGDHGFLNLSERPDVDRVRLDDYSAGRPPDIITMDVEGSEFEVVKGAECLLLQRRTIVFMSVHPEFMFQQHGQYQAELWRYLKDLGYEPEFLAFDHEQHWAWRPL